MGAEAVVIAGRARIVLASLLALALVAGLVVLTRGPSGASPSGAQTVASPPPSDEPTAGARGEGAPARSAAAAAPVPPDAGVLASPSGPMTIREQAAAVGDLDISDGIDLPLPALPTGPPVDTPEPPPSEPARVVEQREQGMRLLDNTLERLEREAQELEAAGDPEGAARIRVRLARTTALRARRAAELETVRGGETLPTTDPEERLREGTLVPESP